MKKELWVIFTDPKGKELGAYTVRGTFSEDKDGNKHYQSFGADGKLTGEHHRNKDGSSSGWQKTGDTMVTWSKDGQGNGESRNYYKGELLSGTTTKDGQTTRWEA